VLRTFSYQNGYFDVSDEDGEFYARVPIAFELILSPEADKVHLDTAGKILCTFIAESYGEKQTPEWN